MYGMDIRSGISQCSWTIILTHLILLIGINGEWIGRRCCDHAVEHVCRSECRQSKSMETLTLRCREDVETDLYGCIFRHQRKKRCCGKSSSNMTATCQRHCVLSFHVESGPTSENMRDVERYCPKEVLQCTKNFSDDMRKSSNDGVVCCDRSNSEKCRTNCRQVMSSFLTEQQKIDKLVEACGSPIPREPMWKCLISRNGEKPRPALPRVGHDLQCCSKAISSNCRQLCTKLYSKPWESPKDWEYFKKWCEFNSEESDLNICLQEVREPCKMGCNDLKFCTNFNNRPTELFHSCNARADNIARAQIREWSNKGAISLPVAQIPVLDITTCEPDKWKVVACSLEIKPCSTTLGDSTICRNDCVSLLRECADVTRFKDGTTIEWLCDMLSPSHLQHDCISLEKYTSSSGRSNHLVELSQPCLPNPCEDGQICVVNRYACLAGRKCPAYKCLPGCEVGDGGNLVHIGQRVKISDLNRGEGCYSACACTSAKRLQYCKDLPCMDAAKPCTIVGQIKVHGSHFKIDCNFCSCYNGNVTCTKRQCASSDVTDDNNREFTGLPCNCEGHFVPVCASNGRTYPSACLARCMGHADTDIEFGECKAKDPCRTNPCRRNERCVKASRVCITSSKIYDCPQYECVAPYERCITRRMTRDAYANDGHHYVNHRRLNSASRRSSGSPMFFGYDVDWNHSDPVCDTDGEEYDNICQLRKKHRKTELAYRGHCKKQCGVMKNTPVCGQNIVTYENECAALAERVLVDYKTKCHVVNVHRGKSSEKNMCLGVNCKELPVSDCETVTPPGACCPRCGAMLRVLYSQPHVDAISRSAIQGPITIRDVLRSLRRHMNVQQCDIYGHLTMEADIVILSVPVVVKPTSLQIEACVREAEGLARFINERNPILTSDVILSTLTAAEVHGKKAVDNGAAPGVRLKFSFHRFMDKLRKKWRPLKEPSFLNSEIFFVNQYQNDLNEAKRLLLWISGIYFAHYFFDKLAYSNY